MITKFCGVSRCEKKLLKIPGGGVYTLLKIAAPGPTSSGSFEVVLINKDESCIGQLLMRSLNSAI